MDIKIFALLICIVLICISNHSNVDIRKQDESKVLDGWVTIVFDNPISVKAGVCYEIDYLNKTIKEVD